MRESSPQTTRKSRMNFSRPISLRPFAAALALLAAAVFFAACDLDSVDSTTSVISDNDGTIYDFSGLYARTSSSTNGTNVLNALVYPTGQQSGTTLTWLRLIQYGSVLEGYDNAGMNWEGSISSIASGTAQFNLQGKTTAGAGVEIAGALRYADQSSTLDATWIEPGFAGSIYAQATVSPATTNTPVGEVEISPDSATLNNDNDQETFSATGGSGSYSWSVSGGIGNLSTTTGSSTTFTRTNNGSGTLTVPSGSNSDTASISCP